MFEPISLSLIGQSLVTSQVIGSVIGGIIGNRADAGLCMSLDYIKENLKNNPALVNHDIQRAIRKAYLKATLQTCQSYAKRYDFFDKIFHFEAYDLKNIVKYLDKELKNLPKATYKLPTNPADENYSVLIEKGISAAERVPEMIVSLKNGLFEELKAKQLTVEKGLTDWILNGWEEDGKHIEWFDLLCAYFDDILKTEPRVHEKVHRELLLDIQQKLNVPINGVNFEAAIKQIAEPLQDFIPRLEAFIQLIDQKLDIVIDQNQTTHDKLDDLDKKVSGLENKIAPSKSTKPLTDIPALGTFIGREDDLKKLTETLEQSQHVVLVNGIGGIGKTTLAKAYVDARKADFDHIAWINVLGNSTQEAFVNTNYIDDALNQAKFTQGDTDVRFGAIMKVLKQLQGKGLLVIDNAETDIEDISQDLPTLNWKVLLTSRDNLDGYQTLPLDELSPADALVLFRTYYKGKASDHDLHALLQTIDYHTLTIELLAKTLEKSDDEFDLAELQDKLTQRQLDDERLARTIKTDHRNAKQTQLFKHLLATFELSEKHRNPYEIWVLKQFAALPPEPQAIKTLREWLKIEDENSKKAFAKAIENLHTTGWLRKTRNPEGETCYTLHRLIQDMVQYQHPISYEDVAILIDTFESLLWFDASTNFATKFQYLSPAEAVLNSLPEEVENSQIDLLSNNIGVVYRNFADFKNAIKYLEKSLTFSQNQNNDDEIATSQSNLALVYLNLGEYTKAADLLENTLDIQSKVNHPNLSITQSNLAVVYRNLGEYTKAADLLENALQSDIQNFGEVHPTVAIRQSNLALVYQDLREYTKAADLLQKAIISLIQNLGESHPNVTQCQSNLALVYLNLGEYTKAVDLLEKALQSNIQNYGESHPNVAKDQLNLAVVLLELNRIEEANSLLEKAYTTFVLRLGTEHPETKNCLAWLNDVKGMLG